MIGPILDGLDWPMTHTGWKRQGVFGVRISRCGQPEEGHVHPSCAGGARAFGFREAQGVCISGAGRRPFSRVS